MRLSSLLFLRNRESLILLVCVPHPHLCWHMDAACLAGLLIVGEPFLVLYSTYPPFNKALRNHWGSNEESLRFYVASQLPERTSEEPVKHQKCCVHNYLYEPAVLLHVLSIKDGSDLQQFLWSMIHWCEFLCVCVSSSCWLGPWMGSWGSFRPLTGFLCATTPAPASTPSPSGLHEFSRPQRGPCRIH